MASVAESVGAKTPMGSDLAEGVETLDLEQEITFTRYVRLVLPLDGFVFWVRANLVTLSALLNHALCNRVAFNQAPRTINPETPTLNAKGSLHYATDVRQEAGETYAANRIVFTSEQPINDLSAIAPGTLWIGSFQGKRFAFSSRSSFYRQSDLFHYVGFAVYPDMMTQIIDDPAGFDTRGLVVSNSLPAWLALNSYFPPYGFPNPGLTFYPSYLVPENLEPPFVAVDIFAENTRALASAPTIDKTTGSHHQLSADIVKLTLWGTRNDTALDLLDCINQYSTDVRVIGVMNMPVPRDEKRTQSELNTIAMKKSIEIEVSYLQHCMRDLAVQYIKSAIVNFGVSAAA